MVLTRSMAKIKAEAGANSGPKTSPPDTVNSKMNTAMYRDVTGAVARGRDPSGIKDTRACEAPKENDPTEDRNHCSVTDTSKIRRDRTAAPSSKSRSSKKASAKESGLKSAFLAESATASGFPSFRQGQKRRKEEDEGNKENESTARQCLPSTNARRVRRRIAVNDEVDATTQNMESLDAAEDLSSSRSLRRLPSRTEYSVDEVIATVALLQLASGKPNWSASMFPTSSEVEGNRVLVSEPTLSLCNHDSEQILKGIGIPGIEAVVVLVGA
ncbi:hypothetical protein ACEPAG_2664 [Sanghuangporus baumii]